MSGPVTPAFQQSYKLFTETRRRQWEPQENDPAGGWQATAKSELAKVLVEGQEKSILTPGLGQDIDVRRTRRIGANPTDVMTAGPKGLHGGSGDVLVREEAHSGRDRKDLLGLKQLHCVREASLDIVPGQAWVARHNLISRPSLGKEVDHVLDGDARSSHYGLAPEDSGIDMDAIGLVHAHFPRPF